MKAALRVKFLALGAFIKKKKLQCSQITNLMMHLKAMEKSTTNQTQYSKLGELIKIRD